MLVNMKDMLEAARNTKTAVGAFNCTTLETARAAIDAAEELGLPFILQHTSVHEEYIPFDIAGPLMLALAKRAKVPVCVHLDHGENLEKVAQAIQMGFTSVMIDAADKSFEDNLRETMDVTRMAHAVGVTVEAELGNMPHNLKGELKEYTPQDFYTVPSMAKEFVEKTRIDALAISFGTIHGVYPDKPALDFSIVQKVAAATDGIPLVMHGASGLSDSDYRTAIANGIRKINYYTYESLAGGRAIYQIVKDTPEGLQFHDASTFARKYMKEDVKRVMRIFAGK